MSVIFPVIDRSLVMRSSYITLFMLFFSYISNVVKATYTILYPWWDDDKFKEKIYYLALLKLVLENSKE